MEGEKSNMQGEEKKRRRHAREGKEKRSVAGVGI